MSAQRKAREFFEKSERPSGARLLRSRATEAYLEYWMSKSALKKRQLLEKSWSLAKKALQSFERSNNYAEYAKTYDRLSVGVGISLESDWRLKSRIKKCSEAVEYGKKSVSFLLQAMAEKQKLARALVRTALFLDALSEILLENRRAPRFQREALQLWTEAQRISRDAALRQTSLPPAGFGRIMDQNQSIQLSREALKRVAPANDKFAIAWLTEKLAKWSFYAAESIESPAERTKRHVEALHLAEEAASNFDIVGYTSAGGGVLWVHSPYAEHFLQLATYDDDPARRRQLQEKSLQSTPELIRLAMRSGHPQVASYAFHIGGKSAAALADIEPNKSRKIKLLREALRRRIRAYEVTDKVEPLTSWNRGIMLRYQANIEARLAELVDDSTKQRELFEKSSLTQEKGLRFATDYFHSFERTENHVFRGPIGRFYFEHATVLLRLKSITGNEKYLRGAAKEYTTAADWFLSINRYAGAAECYWKAAEAHDSLQAYSLASENFAHASKAYSRLGKKVPPLKEHSRDYARYMNAWSKIELARSNHSRLLYESAADLYKSVAGLHGLTKRWSFLTSYYSAWFKLELAEGFSRNSRHQEAIQTLREAATLFKRSITLSKQRLDLIDQPDERAMVTRLVNAPREAYCKARVTLEEATLAESDGDYRTAFEKFGLASGMLKEIYSLSNSEQEKEETGFLSILCQAWQLSDKAELEDSTEPLEEACRLFANAKKMSRLESARKLAAAHEEFCRALVASHKFAATMDSSCHNEALKQFDAAINDYRDSGFGSAAEHAMARKLLLEASAYLSRASGESDHGKRTESYKVASTLLEESAKAFQSARLPRKREQAIGLLEKARVESKIALQLKEILDTASGSPTNVAFRSPLKGDERAVGLDRFEHGDIDARLTKASQQDGHISFEMDVLNVGEQPIRVVRVQTEIGGESGHSSMTREENVLAVDERIDPASMNTIKVGFPTKLQALFKIRPRIIFVVGNGEERQRLVEEKIVATSPIIEFLSESFVSDYADRRLAESSCGWRTLMEVVNELKIPRSNVYGEPRYGRIFGRQLESLINSSLVEYRIFPGERGRGGEITKVRVLVENENVKRYLQQLAAQPGRIGRLNQAILSPVERPAARPEIIVS